MMAANQSPRLLWLYSWLSPVRDHVRVPCLPTTFPQPWPNWLSSTPGTILCKLWKSPTSWQRLRPSHQYLCSCSCRFDHPLSNQTISAKSARPQATNSEVQKMTFASGSFCLSRGYPRSSKLAPRGSYKSPMSGCWVMSSSIHGSTKPFDR
jgi:hypothetical protein